MAVDFKRAAARSSRILTPRDKEFPEEFRYLATHRSAQDRDKRIPILPSQFTEFAVKMPEKTSNSLIPFTFEGRRYLKDIYDCPSRHILLRTARQVEKSTTLGNKMLAFGSLVANSSPLYVSPSMLQTKEFSRERLTSPVRQSQILQAWFPHITTKDSVLEKEMINGSKLRLRYAFLNADRVRGIPADFLFLDEIQNILVDNIPVIEQCLSHSPYKFYLYAGTPLSVDNTIEQYWEKFSTQNEWVVPCTCRLGTHHKYHWNILGPRSIGLHGPICTNCGKVVDPSSPLCHWVRMNTPQVVHPFEGFRIPQLMVPWIIKGGWSEVLDFQKRYGQSRFYNEVLGLSCESGQRPLTRTDLINNCRDFDYSPETLINLKHKLGSAVPIFFGIDWGQAGETQTSYTVLTIAAYINNRFRVLFVHRFEGSEVDPTIQLEKIIRLIDQWKPTLVGCDYGSGFYQNRELQNRFGPNRVIRYQHSGSLNAKVKWDEGLKRFLLNRGEIMQDIFTAIKRADVFDFPRWETFEPFSRDYLSIFSEYNPVTRVNTFKHQLGTQDDAFHSLLFCFMVSTLRFRRPDIFSQRPSAKQVAE